MGLLDKLFETRHGSAGAEQRNLSLTNYAQWVELGIADQSTSGVVITPHKALNLAAVYACVRIIAETVASLPLIVYERQERGKLRAPEHHLYTLLKERPNEMMTAFEYRETIQGHLALWGNAYSQITYDNAGRVIELFPLRPDMMVDYKDGAYIYQLSSGELKPIPERLVWHLRGLSSDGRWGLSPITLAKQSLGLGLAAEEFGARFYGNGANLGGVLEHPGRLGPEALGHLRESFTSDAGGLSNAHKIKILEEGMKYTQITIPPENAQFLETRKFQVSEVARWFRMQPHKIGDLEHATFSNIEHQGIEFATDTIWPWTVRWQQSIHHHLMPPKDRQKYFAEFLMDALLRGDTISRYEAYSTGRQNGWLSANDIRELENMNPIEGGDVYLAPLNMVPVEQLGQSPVQVNTLSAPVQVRQETRAVGQRQRLQQTHISVFAETLTRIYRREINDVRRTYKKMSENRALPEFENWLREYYQDHREFIAAQLRTVHLSYSQLVSQQAADETNADIHPEAVEKFSGAYGDRFAERQAANSQTRLEQALIEEEPAAAMEKEFDNWIKIRALRTAAAEVVQLNNAVAVMVYGAAGVTAKRWLAFGDNCPYCRSLNGRTVGLNQSFIDKNQDFNPEGALTPLRPSVNVGHPPAHDGCDCMIVSG